MKRYLPLLALLISCTRPPIDTSVKAAQARIAERDVGWIFDSIPVMRFRPPWVYGMWRLQVEECTGIAKEGWPRLFIAPVSTFGHGFAAAYFSDANAIVFGLGNEARPAIVRHELIHFLLAPDSTHHERYFSADPLVGRCAQFLSEG